MRGLAAICLLLIIIAGLALGVGMVCMPFEQSLSRFVIEDLFYYLTSARNVAAGRGPSLDGLHATNGFHPLWLLMLTGVSLAAGSRPVLTVHAALGLALLFHWLSVGLLAACVHRLLGALPALAVAALLTCNYRLLSFPLGGLETSVAGAMVLLVTVFYAFGRPLDSARGSIGLGLLLGVTFLARLDTLLFGAVLLAFAALPDGIGPRGRRRLALAFVAGTVALAVCVPWFVFSMKATGVWLPASGEAISTWGGNPWRSVSSPLGAIKMLSWLLTPAANDLANVLGFSPRLVRGGRAGLVAVGVVSILVIAVVALAWRQRESPLVRRLAWVPAYAGLHVAYYVAFGHALFRYFYPVLFPVLLFVAVVVSESVRRADPALLRERRGLLAVPLVLVAVSAISGARAFRLGVADGEFHGVHPALYRAALWIERQTPPDAVIGSFNAGIISYFSGRPTVNLDGVMNYGAIAAIRERRIADYIRENGVTHLADVESQLDRYMGDFAGEADWRKRYREVAGIEITYFGGARRARTVVLERVTPPSDGDPRPTP